MSQRLEQVLDGRVAPAAASPPLIPERRVCVCGAANTLVLLPVIREENVL